MVPGLSSADVKDIADQVFGRTDENHPHHAGEGDNGFLDILANGEPVISASSIFVNKVTL